MLRASQSAVTDSPINTATYQFTLSKYPSTSTSTVSQFPDDHSRATSRGKFYIRLYVRGSTKDTFKIRSPIGRISNSGLYSSRAEADLEVLTHRCIIEGLGKRGEEWFIPSSSPAAKYKKASCDEEAAAIETSIKSLRMAIEEKAASIVKLESQLCHQRSSLVALRASLLQAETASASAFTAGDKRPNEGDDEAMSASINSCTPAKGIFHDI